MASDSKKFLITMVWFVPFVFFCIFIITNALKPRPVTPLEIQPVVQQSIPAPYVIVQEEEIEEVIAVAPLEGPAEVYIVKEGDTLSYIAMLYTGKPSKYAELAKINGIDNPNLIFPGQHIKVPL